jgi:tetratricopeptide (TPR) repeat protein
MPSHLTRRHFLFAATLAGIPSPSPTPPDATTCFVEGMDQLVFQKDFDQALHYFSQAIQLNPKHALALALRGETYRQKGLHQMAINDFHESLRVDPNPSNACALYHLAWELATCPDPIIRNGTKAIGYALRACSITRDSKCLEALAAAYAEAGQFREAIKWQEKVLADPILYDAKEIEEAEMRLEMYQAERAFRDQV